jgi:hypothetical protein
MAATRAFSKFQYGKEVISTHGTAVAATKILAGAQIKGVPTDRQTQFIEDALGVRAASARSNVYELLVEDTLTLPACYFQALPMIFSCGLKGNITASEVTANQGDYLWTFTPSMTATNAPDSITLEMGDDTQAYEVEYVMFRSIKVSGEIAQDGGDSPVQVEVEYFGRQVTATTFTGALSLPTMTTMNAKQTILYKDALWANKGTTALASTLRGFEFEIMTGLHPKFFGSADKYFTTHGESILGAMLTLTLEGNSSADGIFDDYQAGTAAAYAIKITGPLIGTGTAHSLNLFVYGKPESVIPLNEESSGNNLHAVVIHGMYDTTGAQILDVLCTTNSNTI